MNDKEFEKQFVEATRRGRAKLDSMPKAAAARYDRRSRRMVLDLQNGVTLLVPVDLIQGLKSGDARTLSDLELVLEGTQVHWRTLDVQMHVGSLIEGVFGTPAWMDRLRQHYSKIGAKGGSQTSAQKTAASRANGAKGGRPRKAAV